MILDATPTMPALSLPSWLATVGRVALIACASAGLWGLIGYAIWQWL